MKKLPEYLVKDIANLSETPGQFLRYITALEDLRPKDFAVLMNVQYSYISQLFCNGTIVGINQVLRIANLLNIDPLVLNGLYSDYNMRILIKEQKEQQSQNEIQVTADIKIKQPC